MAIHLTPEANPTVQEGTLYVDSATGEFNVAGRTTPHIIPGVLYPAVAGKLLDGSTSHSGNYGTAQSDGRSYYYTDIKGSRPIKDPRIGGHFGSQRYKFKSLQLLEQETATHGDEVYSIDGREWVRGVKGVNAAVVPNDDSGNRIRVYGFVEIVGYFIDVNLIIGTHTNDREFNTSVDGGSASSANTLFQTSSASPLGGRYVDVGSVGNLGLGLSLGIHTLKVTPQAQSENIEFFGIELIAQDTTSTANRSKIQIPSQDVVSYGKKFTVSAEGSSGHHYDPFNGFTSGSSVSSYVDTDTSLGLERWKNSSTYYRPYNGGRVVKWVDSSGVIKTSVTMMPPNAQTTFGVAKDEKGDDSAGNTSASVANDNYKPTISDQSVDFSLLEKATSLHYREFGNGSANGNATYADASTLNTDDDIAYVMDDGLTSVSADDAFISSGYFERSGANDFFYLTFIGTGCSWNSNATKSQITNLPYGTHVLKGERTGSSPNFSNWTIDGQEFTNPTNGYYAVIRDFFDIHQPKRPPIPEDACVLADYMLMADFVPQTSAGTDKISKGTRKVAISRDVFFTGEAMSVVQSIETDSGWIFYLNSNGTNASTKLRIPSFGTNFVKRGFHDRSTLFIGDSSQSSNQTASTGSGAHGDTHRLTANQNLGVYNFGSNPHNGANGITSSFEIVTPIHTSSHYQTFETPFLHELVGGDRNMEQANLVVSPDGKTWDQITRDTSYIGSSLVAARVEQGSTSGYLYQDTIVKWDEWRGVHDQLNCGNKDWAIAYDRMICLKDGEYTITAVILHHSNDRTRLVLNGSDLVVLHETGQNDTGTIHVTQPFKRGDYVYIYDGAYEQLYSHFQITKA